MALLVYHPEMGEKKPEAQMEASLSHYGKHYFVDTKPDIVLKGRGIEFLKTYEPRDFHKDHQRRVGWHSYQVTTRAFDILKQTYEISYEMLLD